MTRTVACLCLACAASTGTAAEIASNGAGGGRWTDPGTWRMKAVPGPDDDVVIQKNDIVVFDRPGDGKLTCRKLQIDPRGGLTFKTGAGKLVLAVADGIEAFGPIRLDGTRSAGDDFAIRLTGEPAKRLIKIGKGGALLLYGRANLPEGRRNVTIVSPPEKDMPVPALVDAEVSVMIDWQRAAVRDVKLTAKSIDNTGGKANERLRIVDSVFMGAARLYAQGCDTPEISRNCFDNSKGKQVAEPAISVHSSPLAEIKDNTVHGGFSTGVAINADVDAVVTGNTIAKCGIGIQGGYGIPNLMIKHAVIRGCETGLKLEGGTGVVEDVLVEGATTAFTQTNCRLQLTGFRFKDLAKKGVAITVESGELALLNCDVRPADVKAAAQAAVAGKPPPVPVACLQYVTVACKQAPAGSVVELRTASGAPPAGVADPSVRNSPAPLIDGLTPLPKLLRPLIVRSWSWDAAGKPVLAPTYTLRVLGPAPKEGANRPVLATQPFQPPAAGFRADANDKTPTVEVLLK